ncbi:protein phosphatase 2C domain-containing protein [Xylanibacter rodentium]|uniref:protein phosphatase 2C domain-containing protein n=1 Tax=Xylanibacter rodentium TaxID=2736289 RepID=UPI002591DFE9|nr:protein phosphatase 2C domain-containing protein [Xylanibacter rodentium]
MDSIFHYCRGFSHIATDKPCQDCAYAESVGSLSMAIVSDGHGGDRYFRSDVGSKLLVEITAEAIRQFSELGGGYGGLHILTSEDNSESNIGYDVVNHKLRWLFSSIIAQWNTAIEKHFEEHPLTEWELSHIEDKYRSEFLKAQSHEKTYGCTLMAFFRTSTYWIAFQIGDGKLLTLNMVGEEPVFNQPVPWDEKCFLNKTTSICDSNALDEFRYCYCSDKSFPAAVFLGSDGLDDTYGDGELLENFYMNVLLEIARGKEKAQKTLESDLPEISKRGSKDDMSVAVVYDDTDIVSVAIQIVNNQMERNVRKREEIEDKINRLKSKIENCETAPLSESERIEMEYAKKDLAKAETALANAQVQWSRLCGKKGFYQRLANNLKNGNE